MNKPRREELRTLQVELQGIRDRLQQIHEDEETFRDAVPVNLQGSDYYQKSDDACRYMDNALDALQEALDDLDNAVEE